MGLSGGSTGKNAAQKELKIAENTKTVALAGNPNVGKSTVFNALTGLHQHTGNWPGKTVTSAVGTFTQDGREFSLVDLPGTYSLFPHSQEEAVARDFLCFEKNDCVVVVCDCTTLERSLALVLQVLEVTRSAVVCLNLFDEAKKKNIKINAEKLEELLGEAASISDVKELATFYHDSVFAQMGVVREVVDKLETMVAEDYWPVPTYGDILFSVK